MGRGEGRLQARKSIDFFVSLMLRYPEIATIKYDSLKARLNFTFIISGAADTKRNKFKETLTNAMGLFHKLSKNTLPMLQVDETTYDQITVIEIKRDVQSLCYNEIDLFVSLFREYYGPLVFVDPGVLFEEDLLLREERIKHTLENLKHTQLKESLIALREEGQVRVFNK